VAKSVGIDIGSHACKVAVLDGGPKGAKLLRFAEQRYELGEGGAVTPAIAVAALKKALHEAKAPRHMASLALPAEQCILREISVPFAQDEQIKKVVKFEFEPHLHNAAIENVVLDFIKTGAARVGTRLLIFAVQKPALRTRLEQLRQAGVDPLHVDVDVTALLNVAFASGVLEEHPNCLIIDIGSRTTKTLYVRDGRLKVARSIRLGAGGAAKRLTSDMQGDEETAAIAMANAATAEALALPPEEVGTVEMVRSVAAIEREVARGRQDQFLQRVVRETQRTLPLLAEDETISQVFVTGGGVRKHPNVREQLADRFSTPVSDLPVLSAVDHDLPPSEAVRIAATGAVAIGTALKVLGIDTGHIDLRREEFRFARTFDQLKNALATGVTLAFFAVFLLWLSFFMEQQKASRELRSLQGEANQQLRVEVFDLYEESVPEARKLTMSKDPDKYFQSTGSALKRIQGQLKDELGLGTEVPPIASCLETWQAVMKSLESVRSKVEYLAIKEESYSQEKCVLTVVLGKYTDVDTVIAALRKHTPAEGGRLFDNVENRGITPTKDARILVPIDIILLPPDYEPTEAARGPTPLNEGETDTARGEEPAPAEDFDLIKVYVWVMLAFTVVMAGGLWWTYSSVEATNKRVAAARKSLPKFAEQKREILAMLDVYTTNKEDEARRQPSTWFSRVWQRKGIPNESVRLEAWEEKFVTKGNYYEQWIDLKFQTKAPLTRAQIGKFCHEIERESTRLRILELKVKRAGKRKEEFNEDQWSGSVRVGYRQQRANN
jgi:type IV pilus assembly protein PilM